MPRWSIARSREISICWTLDGVSAFLTVVVSVGAAAGFVVVSVGVLFCASAGIAYSAAIAMNSEVLVRMVRASLGMSRFAMSVFQNDVEADFDALVHLERSEHQ